jgi:putative hydrolase of the HAD superfamily
MKHGLPQAVLLDLDDTILDDSSNVASCWREACFAHQPEMAGLDPTSVYQAIEKTQRWYWGDPERHRVGRLDLDAARREVVRMSLADLGVDALELAAKIADRYSHQRDIGIQPFADAVDTVQWLRESGCRLALLTNGSGVAQRSKITRFGLAELFDLILIEGELGFGKPDPRVYARALDELGVAPAGACMVGDNLEWDVAQPQRQGIFGIWVNVRGVALPGGRSVQPNRIIRRLSELREPGVFNAFWR